MELLIGNKFAVTHRPNAPLRINLNINNAINQFPLQRTVTKPSYQRPSFIFLVTGKMVVHDSRGHGINLLLATIDHEAIGDVEYFS